VLQRRIIGSKPEEEFNYPNKQGTGKVVHCGADLKLAAILAKTKTCKRTKPRAKFRKFSTEL
jgi:hypothetical protein